MTGDPALRPSRRYYPGFFGALFLVLLRTAIGWHFAYEGVGKVYSTPEGRDSILSKVLPPPSEPEPPFSAEGYLRASSGPLAPRFRAMIPDVDGLRRLDVKGLSALWGADLDRYAAHYKMTAEARRAAQAALDSRLAQAVVDFRAPEFADKVRQYRADLAHVDSVLNSPDSMKFERERAYKQRRELESTRRGLMATVDGWTSELHEAWTPEKARAKGSADAPPPALMTSLDWINLSTTFGLIAVGVCLMLGFLTPLAALGGAAFLTMFYLSMPPWPGVPEPPKVEGHYLIVNKNLIELLACLVLASTPSGLWIGLDAVFFGRIGRRRPTIAEASPAAPIPPAAPITYTTSTSTDRVGGAPR